MTAQTMRLRWSAKRFRCSAIRIRRRNLIRLEEIQMPDLIRRRQQVVEAQVHSVEVDLVEEEVGFKKK